jgi:hypothetical protein
MYYNINDIETDTITISKTELVDIKKQLLNMKTINERDIIIYNIDNITQYDETLPIICSLGIGICTIFGSAFGFIGAFIGCSIACITSFYII